jgi:calcineurin-like phosphoesterase family protein
VNRRLCVWSWLVVGLFACAATAPPSASPLPALPPELIETSLYLIGDAGAPDTIREPVLQALGQELGSRRGPRVVVFLGDNAYPRGLPAPGQPGRRLAEFNLAAQVETITTSGASGFFVPGNHDWAKHSPEGWAAIQRQGTFIDSAGHVTVSLHPHGGCPGPDVVDLGKRIRLVMLDTQWWLHHGPKPEDPTSSCPADKEEEIVDSLRAALAGASGRLVVVAAHHPLVSGGEHGGHFNWRDHLFPLRSVVPWLWIPLPWLGSLYPAARQAGISSQDVPSRAYQRMIAAFRRAFTPVSPALYASGHDHDLQVVRAGPARLNLISGAGIYGHTTEVSRIRGTLFARDVSGYARLDVPWSGRARLAVLEVDGTGQSREVFSTWVE